MDESSVDFAMFKSYVKQCKKITSNFDLLTLNGFKKTFNDYLLKETGDLDANKYTGSEEYYDVLFSYLVLLQYEGSVNIINKFNELVAEGVIKRKENNNINKKKSYTLPEGWRIIK